MDRPEYRALGMTLPASTLSRSNLVNLSEVTRWMDAHHDLMGLTAGAMLLALGLKPTATEDPWAGPLAMVLFTIALGLVMLGLVLQARGQGGVVQQLCPV
ncbi:hypothetical protein ACWDA7_42380 [Streptomyces sp. NPDC001156]